MRLLHARGSFLCPLPPRYHLQGKLLCPICWGRRDRGRVGVGVGWGSPRLEPESIRPSALADKSEPEIQRTDEKRECYYVGTTINVTLSQRPPPSPPPSREPIRDVTVRLDSFVPRRLQDWQGRVGGGRGEEKRREKKERECLMCCTQGNEKKQSIVYVCVCVRTYVLFLGGGRRSLSD